MATIAPWKSHVNVNLLDHPVVSEALAPSTVAQFCRQAGHRWRRSFWSPRTTLVTFLLQVLDRVKTLRADVVRKEIAMHLLAYNLIRLLMWQAARQHRRDLHRLSFTGTLDRLPTMLPHMMTCTPRGQPGACC